MLRTIFCGAAILIGTAASVSAAVCEYKPSRLASLAGSALVGTAVTGAGVAMKSAGYYTLVHASSGLTMLGSTAAGTSAAGTVGILAGSGGLIGTIGAIVMSPITIAAGTVAAVGAASYEGACLFAVDRITDTEAVVAILNSVARNDDSIRLVETRNGSGVEIVDESGPRIYLVEKLYIADGRLKHRDWGPNTDLGMVLFVTPGLVE